MLRVKNLNLSADTPNTGTDQSSQAIGTLRNTGSPVVSYPTNWFQKKKAGGQPMGTGHSNSHST
jgi:hypothetical protein